MKHPHLITRLAAGDDLPRPHLRPGRLRRLHCSRSFFRSARPRRSRRPAGRQKITTPP